MIESLQKKRLFFRALLQYGGIPSAHATVVGSLITVVYALEGISSGAFVLSVAVAFFIIRDAIGLRMKIQQQSKAITTILKKINQPTQDLSLEDTFGHSPFEIIIGLLIGVSLSFLLVF